MSKIKVNEIVNRNGSSITIGDASTSTIAINSGTTLTGFSSTGIDDNATSTAITIDSSGNVGIGTTAPSTGYGGTIANVKLALKGAGAGGNNGTSTLLMGGDNNHYSYLSSEHTGGGDTYLAFGTSLGATNPVERMRIGSSGNLLIAKSSSSFGTAGVELNVGNAKYNQFTRSGGGIVDFNRLSDDGEIIAFHQDSNKEGTISVSGATVSYNGFTGTHWSRLIDNSKPTILKGTILESLDEMMDWYQVQFDITETDDEGNETTITKKESYILGDGESVGDVITYNYEGTDYQATIIQEGDVKHTKSKISDTVDAKNVYGVFMDWDNDDDTVNDMYVAQTGTFVVRINGSETVSKGDLIQSNGDGTGKVQADDLLRASTVAKVLSTTKIETYEDGSYIVPCSLHC